MKFIKGSTLFMSVKRVTLVSPALPPVPKDEFAVDVWEGYEVVTSVKTIGGNGLVHIGQDQRLFMLPVLLFRSIKAAIQHARSES